MTTTISTGQTRDPNGNLTGTVHLADGTTETVDQLNAWADTFENDDHPAPLNPPRLGRPNLARRRGHHDTKGESPRITVRLPQALLDRVDTAATAGRTNRADLLRHALQHYLDSVGAPDEPPAHLPATPSSR